MGELTIHNPLRISSNHTEIPSRPKYLKVILSTTKLDYLKIMYGNCMQSENILACTLAHV